MELAINEFLKTNKSPTNPIDNYIFFKTQVDADSLLNAYASLIDYYYIAIAYKMGGHEDIMNKVQYKKISNNLITKGVAWSDYVDSLNKDLSKQFEFKNDSLDKYFLMWSNIFKQELVDWKVMAAKEPAYTEHKEKSGKVSITPHDKVREYDELTRFLHCNRTGTGHKYNIFLELNNYLKHNRYPLVRYETQKLKTTTYAYSFYTIKKEEYSHLKTGIIRSFAEVDFYELKDALAHCYKKTGKYSDLEMRLGIPIIRVDYENGYEYNSSLYFYLDNVLISRNHDSISISSRCLFTTSGRLIREIEKKLDLEIITERS